MSAEMGRKQESKKLSNTAKKKKKKKKRGGDPKERQSLAHGGKEADNRDRVGGGVGSGENEETKPLLQLPFPSKT